MNTNTPNTPAVPEIASPLLQGGTTLLEWSAPIHPVHERSARWYLIGSILILGMAAYGVLTGAWTVTIVTLLIGGLYYMVRHEAPIIRTITIQSAGFTLDNNFTYWGDCKEFWIVHTPGYNELHIRTLRPNKEVIIQTAHIDPTLLRATISQFMQMKSDQREPLMDTLIRIFKL